MTVSQRSTEYIDAVSAQLARVVLSAAYYEDELTIAIGAALDLNALQCNALVRPMNIRGKLDLGNRLMIGGADADKLAVTKHTRRVSRLFDRRNELVHGTFGHDAHEQVSVRSYSGKHKLNGKQQRWTANEISDLADCLIRFRAECPLVGTLLAKALQQD